MTRRLPPLNALRSFEAAARLASFSDAAEELHVTHGAVSRAVRTLEDYLGQKLFERTTRRVRLTPVGARYAGAVRDTLDRLSSATSAIIDERREGPLNVSTLDSFAAKWLVPRLFRFRRAYPDIDIRLATSERLADFVTDGNDIAIRFGRGRYPGLVAEMLMREEVFPACSPSLLAGTSSLKKPQDLEHHMLIHDEFPIDWGMWLRTAGVEGVDHHRGPIFQSSEHAIQAAIQGEGVVLARGSLVADDLRAGRLIKPFKLSLPAEVAYYVVYPPSSLEWKKVAAFRDWVLAESRIPGPDGSSRGRLG